MGVFHMYLVKSHGRVYVSECMRVFTALSFCGSLLWLYCKKLAYSETHFNFFFIHFTSVSARWRLYRRSVTYSVHIDERTQFTVLGLPWWSPIQVLAEVGVTYLQWMCQWASLGRHRKPHRLVRCVHRTIVHDGRIQSISSISSCLYQEILLTTIPTGVDETVAVQNQ